jgi:SAM-dependent methyltransferase
VNGGAVDLVFIGALLLHLRDPVRALEAVHRTLRPGGRLTLVEPVSLAATLLAPRRAVAQFRADRSRSMTWWYPNLRALIAWLVAAGFEEVRRGGFHRPPAFRWMRQSYCSLTARKPG